MAPAIMTSAIQVDRPLGQPCSIWLRKERLRIANACQVCRSKKVKCDGGRPACSRCLEKGENCTYNREFLSGVQGTKRKLSDGTVGQTRCSSSETEPKLLKLESPKKSPVGGDVGQTRCLSSETEPKSLKLGPLKKPPPLLEPRLRSEEVCEKEKRFLELDGTCYTPHCQFNGKVAEVVAAKDEKADLTPPTVSRLIPLVDAPLFGDLDLDTPKKTHDFIAHLPPHSRANDLVSWYLRYIDSIEPILDKKKFLSDYNATWIKPCALLREENAVRLSTLNMVFALAAQRQESTSVEQRDAEANLYFQRAWVVLPQKKVLWGPASVEMVQCLLLMNRYLHCTSHQHKTWMTAGLAVRICQNIRPPDSSSPSESDTERHERELRHKVWASCVGIDRCVSWSLGRTSVLSMIPLPDIPTPDCSDDKDDRDQLTADYEYAVHGLELHEVCNQIQLAQVQTRNKVASELGLPPFYQQGEYNILAVRLDTCLKKWENSLPSDWQFERLRSIADRTARGRAFFLHARLLGARMFLYRPMLGSYLSSKAQGSTEPPDLSDRLVKECATMSVETAEKIVTLIFDSLEPNQSIGVLPWWYRIYYLHIAGTIFLAAMLGDLFTESASKSWHRVLTALREHKKLSEYVPQCIKTFETLSERILASRKSVIKNSKRAKLEEGAAGLCFDEFFKDLDLDFNDFLLGTENVT